MRRNYPVVTVQRHMVDLSFPAESLVEAVQQAEVGARGLLVACWKSADAAEAKGQKGDLLMRIDAREGRGCSSS